MATVETLQVTGFSMSPFLGFQDSALAPELIHRGGARRTCNQESYLEAAGAPTSVLRHVQSFSEASTWHLFPDATCAGAGGALPGGDSVEAQLSPSILPHTRVAGSSGLVLLPSGQAHELGHSKALTDQSRVVNTHTEALESRPLPAWTHYSLRCRDAHCATRSLDEARASTRQGLPSSKGWHRLSNDAEFYSTGPLQAPFQNAPYEEKPKATGIREYRFLSPQTSPLHEGLLQMGCGGGAAPTFSLSDAPERSHGHGQGHPRKLSEGERTIVRLLWSQLVPGGAASQHRQEANSAAESAGYLGSSHAHAFAACSDPSELRDSDSDSYSTSSRSSEDCLGEGKPLLSETDLFRPRRVKSILLVKSAALVDELQQRGQRCKRVRWRDSHGDTLVNIREFDSDGLSSCWTPESSLEEDDEGLCAGCCTVS